MSSEAPMKGPVRHIVMWRVRGETDAERRAALEKVKYSFESLRGRIPGMHTLEIGVDVSRISYACDVVLVTEFGSHEALAAYATHPEHLRVRDELEGLRVERYQVDYSPCGHEGR